MILRPQLQKPLVAMQMRTRWRTHAAHQPALSPAETHQSGAQSPYALASYCLIIAYYVSIVLGKVLAGRLQNTSLGTLCVSSTYMIDVGTNKWAMGKRT